MTAATAPAAAPRMVVATDDSFDGDFFAGAAFLDRDGEARAAVFRFAALRLVPLRAVDRLVAVRRVDFFLLVRALLRLASDRFDMMTVDSVWRWTLCVVRKRQCGLREVLSPDWLGPCAPDEFRKPHGARAAEPRQPFSVRWRVHVAS